MRKLHAMKQVLLPVLLGIFTLIQTHSLEAGKRLNFTFNDEVLPKTERLPLNAIGQDAIVSFGTPEFQMIHVDVFIASLDNPCGMGLTKSVIRLDDGNACGYAGNGMPNDSIAVCCADVGNTIMVQVSISDACGGNIVFMVNVIVQDGSPPQIMACVSDITLSCSYPIDLNDLSVLGVMEVNTESMTEFTVNDPLFTGGGPDGKAFHGMVMENCPGNLTIDEEIEDLRSCGTGEILRTFIVTDGEGNIASCTQTITLINPFPFSEADITWPPHVEYNSCMNDGIDPTITGRPQFNLKNICSQPAASYTDWIFQTPNSGCVMVERKWKVIDWCTFDRTLPPGSDRPGEWFYKQYIKVINTEAPEFPDMQDTVGFCITGTECAQLITLEAEAIDDCTLPQDILYSFSVDQKCNGYIDTSGYGASFQILLIAGSHKIHWKASDRCGNVAEFTQVVIIKDCKSPVPICHLGLSTSVTPMGMVEIWASDFNNKSHDLCTPPDLLKFSFSADTSDRSRIFDCDDTDSPVTVEMWVTDLDGNQAFCVTTIDVQDNPEICENNEGMPRAAMISGQLITPMNTPIKDAQVNIEGPEYDDYRMTNPDGKYAFEELHTRYGYEVFPIKDDSPMSGVSTLDLILIQQHILGTRPIDNPFRLIAADINNSGSITATDIIQLRKMILGLYDAFPENNSWRFVHAQQGIIDNDSPWPFVEGLYVPDLIGDVMNGDFIGIKIGDVNQSIEEELNRKTIANRNSQIMVIHLDDKYAHAGEVVEVRFRLKSSQDLVALQWTISLDDEKLTFLDWKAEGLDVKPDELAILEGEGQHITMAWSNLSSSHISSGAALITLYFKIHENILLSEHMEIGSNITKAIAYNSQYERMGIQIEWNKHEQFGFAVYQNNPNPFNQQTLVSFDLPFEGFAEVIIHDGAGKQLFKNRGQFSAGRNHVMVSNHDLGRVSGVLYYTIQTESHSATKKMIYIK